MGAWPQVLEGQNAIDYGTVTASSTGTGVTCGTANTKGSWTQLVASTTSDASQLLVMIGQGSAAASYLIDIGIGAAASEVALIPNLRYSLVGTTGMTSRGVVIPCSVPSGSRLSARGQCATASATFKILVIAFT